MCCVFISICLYKHGYINTLIESGIEKFCGALQGGLTPV